MGYAYRFAGMLDESLAECELGRSSLPWVRGNGSVLNAYAIWANTKFLESLPLDDSSFILYRGFGEFHEKQLDKPREISIALTNSILLCMQESARRLATSSNNTRRKAWTSCAN